MNIKLVEEMTGISKQNIRFYEKQGLLHPKRNVENDYRKYSMEDIRTLKVIKILRKLKFPIEKIQLILKGQLSLKEALKEQQCRIKEEKEQMDAILSFCALLENEELETLNVDSTLAEIEKKEQEGGRFGNFLQDFMQVVRAEEEKSFSFMPDTMVLNSREFLDALFQYGNQNNLNLVVTKEGMYPEFTLDGVEYEAERHFSRYGAVITCTLKNPEQVEPAHIPQRKRRLYRHLWKWGIPFLLFFLFYFGMESRVEDAGWEVLFIAVCMAIVECADWLFFHPNDIQD
ncbi:MAG: MerR family transcriptional regulator [Clostridiales bacterium]|nr:MerR family transcriptional regulator [Clostridiales bacterium]